LARGQISEAIEVTDALLARDEEDYVARLIRARAHEARGDLAAALADMRRAFENAPAEREKARVALQAARYAFAAGRWTAAQIWLRRAAIHAPDDAFIENLARDYAQVRAVNPFNLRLRFAVTPSDNINNGADSALLTIDGSPSVGFLSGDALALSGQIISSQIALSYNLARGPQARTDIRLTYSRRDVRLSDGARTSAPGARAEDYESAVLDLDLTRVTRLNWGATPLLGVATLNARDADAQSASFRGLSVFGRLQDASLRDTNPFLTFGLERRDYTQQPSFDSKAWSAGAGLTHALGQGQSLELILDHADRDSDNPNNAFTETTLSAIYTAEDALDWFDLTASLSIARTDYAEYRLGGSAIQGGREDNAMVLRLRGVFSDLSYAGFAPAASLTMGRRSSNISRFDTRETSLGIEIVSSF